ncbi:MAG: molybdopterin cofactor-binding domain-containing protein [Dehalobacterium sp.]
MSNLFHVVGKSVVKSDAADKVLGKSQFAADLKMPEMLHAKALRSPIAHGYIKNIDISAAKAMPGVAAVLTHKDVPGTNGFGIILKDEPVLAQYKVRCYGDAVALVAAETEDIAIQALQKIIVDYEEITPIFCPEEAMEESAPKIHGENNILMADKMRKGDADAALDKCDLMISNTYTTQMIEHCYIEPEAGIAYMDGDTVVVKVSTQNPHYDRRDVAANLALPQNRVRIIQAATGGGFGGKLDISTQIHTALLALKTGRPVRMVYTREESFMASSKRHPSKIEYITGATKDGLLQAVKVRFICDTGAYASYGPATMKRAMVHATGPYQVPHVSVDAYCVYTNNPRAGAMRGFGVPQVAFAHESQMDQLAIKAGISPFEVRVKNALVAGAVTATGQKIKGSDGLIDTVNKVNERLSQYLSEGGKKV